MKKFKLGIILSLFLGLGVCTLVYFGCTSSPQSQPYKGSTTQVINVPAPTRAEIVSSLTMKMQDAITTQKNYGIRMEGFLDLHMIDSAIYYNKLMNDYYDTVEKYHSTIMYLSSQTH